MESDIIFGKMVDYYRKENHLTMEELGSRLGKTKSTISRWVSGERSPKMEEVEQIAKFFNTDVHTLVFGTKYPLGILDLIVKTATKLQERRQQRVLNCAENELKEQLAQSQYNSMEEYRKKAHKVLHKLIEEPVIEVNLNGSLSAGVGFTNYCKDRTSKTVFVRESEVPPSHDLAFEVSGDSMLPLYQDGDVVFIKFTATVHNRAIMAVEIDGEAFLKKLYLEDGRLRLVSLNDDVDEDGNLIYPDSYADESDEIYIIGKVVN